MRRLSQDELLEALAGAGVERGDVVHVQSDLRRIGPVESEGREGVLAFYLEAFLEVLGPEGTLTCSTAFEDYGRYGTPFVLEASPSLTDTFSEYVRTRPGAIRSLHPIVSVTGLGARADEICGGPHFEGFGYESAWGRLHRANAKIMSLGLGPLLGGTTFFHYIETAYGVPYKYTKVYDAPVIADGDEVEGPFTLAVRYLDFGIVNTPVRMKPLLVDRGVARCVPTGRAETWCCPAKDAFDVGIEMLNSDRYFLLEGRPKFRAGEIPAEGPTGHLRVHYDLSEEHA